MLNYQRVEVVTENMVQLEIRRVRRLTQILGKKIATGVATEARNAARTKPKLGRNQHRLRLESLLSLLI